MCSHCGHRCRGRYDKQVCRVRDLSLAGWRLYLEYERWRVNCPGCSGVHVEHLDWLANNPRYTQRFATHVGKLCRDMPNKAVAEMERLHHGTVKDLDKLYMQEQVDRAALPAPRAIGIDESSSRKGHKEAFGQLWDYRTEGGARAFFTRWKDSLKWQRLHPYQKFAEMIEAHWDGIASYCHPENKVSLGLVEGVNNKIRVLQRRAYGYRDEEYLKLKIVAAFLPSLPRNAVFNPHESA